MGQFKDISIKDVMQEINVSYFLPDIQREYVWLDNEKERKIEKLFDSILRGYPIGSFLFWKLRTCDVETNKNSQPDPNKINFQLYRFIERYDVRNPHNDKIDVSQINSNDLYIVLDGQQRLTSLYIGLRGSRTLKKPKGWWDNPNSFEEKELYLNLRYVPDDNDADDGYQFEFKAKGASLPVDSQNYWFKVGDILNIPNLFSYVQQNQLGSEEGSLLGKLQNSICMDRLISYYEETEKSLDKVLKIFIRVNSGGTQLSYSDLLMSILTANFSSDIREYMNILVDEIANKGFRVFGRDQVLKTCLMLIGANHKFQLKNFNKQNIINIESNLTKITNSIQDSIQILSDFGYAGELSSGYIVSVLALYLYNKNLTYSSTSQSDKDEMLNFVRNAQITAFLTTSLDAKLTIIVSEVNKSNTFKDFNDNMAVHPNQPLKITKSDVDDIINIQFGSPAILPILQLLYPQMNFKNAKFHIDHIYPKSKFNQSNKDLDPSFYDCKNGLYNLQLLSESENTSKGAKDPKIWINSQFKTPTDVLNYKNNNYIDSDSTMEWNDFGNFMEKRKALIVAKLKSIFP